MDVEREIQKKIKKKIISARKNIKKKYMLLKRGEDNLQQNLEILYKPILNSLSKTSEKIIENEEIKPVNVKEEDQHNKSEEEYKTLKLGKHVFGIRRENGYDKIGNQTVNINDSILNVGNNKYELSEGLKELLTKSKPQLNYSNEDLKIYKQILMQTNAHLVKYQDGNDIQANKSYKYRYIISKLFNKKKAGGGIEFKNTMYPNIIYYDDVNELIDRLRLLHAEKQSGNTGVDNEIISIQEELREIGLIE